MSTARLRRISALLTAALLLVSGLASCGTAPQELPDIAPRPDPAPAVTPDPEPKPEPEPEPTLPELFEVSAAELQGRFSASRLCALEGLFGAGAVTARFQGSLAETGLAYAGSLTCAAGAASLSLAAGENGPEALMYFDSRFAGLSCQPLFGDERFYGLRPYGLREQLEESALASVLSVDMEAVAELDRLLDAIPEDAFSNPVPLSQSLLEVTRRLIDSHEFEKSAAEVSAGGETAEGRAYTAQIPAAELAGYLRELTGGRQELAIILSLLSREDDVPDIDAAIDSLEASGGTAAVTFYADETCVRRVKVDCLISGADVSLDARLFGGSGDTLLIELAPFFELELTAGEDVRMALYSHIGDGSVTTLDWTGDGTLDFITYSTDITTLALDGAMSADENGLTFEGVWTSGNKGDLNPLRLACSPGGEIAEPEDKVLLTELTQRQIFLLVTRAVLNVL